MFYYISFLRPPLHASILSAPLTLTPQVSNDLRSESFPSTCDIFYHWIDANSGTPLTNSTKLTTWREASAYKSLTIPPPPLRVREACCTLILTSEPTRTPGMIDLCAKTFGRVPLPVMSLPISFGPNASSGKKQESVERVFKLCDGVKDEPTLRIREMTSYDLDKKLWDSGLGLSQWLAQQMKARNPDAEALEREVWDMLFGRDTLRAIELGAGTGMVSIVLAALRSKVASTQDWVTQILSTDLPSSIELMEHNIRTNELLFVQNPPSALSLNWEEELPHIVRSMGSEKGFNAVVMADVTYNTASFPALISTLSALFTLRPSSPPLLLLAYKERDPAERDLWGMLEREVGMTLERTSFSHGAGGQAVEIWLGRRVVS